MTKFDLSNANDFNKNLDKTSAKTFVFGSQANVNLETVNIIFGKSDSAIIGLRLYQGKLQAKNYNTDWYDIVYKVQPGSVNQVGSFLYYTVSTAPEGYLKCNGALVSRVTYADLFAVIGTTYGEGDGSTTFGLPDLRGYFLRSWADDGSIDSGRVLGSFADYKTKSHNHEISLSSFNCASVTMTHQHSVPSVSGETSISGGHKHDILDSGHYHKYTVTRYSPSGSGDRDTDYGLGGTISTTGDSWSGVTIDSTNSTHTHSSSISGSSGGANQISHTHLMSQAPFYTYYTDNKAEVPKNVALLVCIKY